MRVAWEKGAYTLACAVGHDAMDSRENRQAAVMPVAGMSWVHGRISYALHPLKDWLYAFGAGWATRFAGFRKSIQCTAVEEAWQGCNTVVAWSLVFYLQMRELLAVKDWIHVAL